MGDKQLCCLCVWVPVGLCARVSLLLLVCVRVAIGVSVSVWMDVCRYVALYAYLHVSVISVQVFMDVVYTWACVHARHRTKPNGVANACFVYLSMTFLSRCALSLLIVSHSVSMCLCLHCHSLPLRLPCATCLSVRFSWLWIFCTPQSPCVPLVSTCSTFRE